MTTYKVSTPGVQPAPIKEDRWVNNGRMPAPAVMNKVARILNCIAGYQSRCLFIWAQAPGVPTDTPGSSSEVTSRCVFRTGENVDRLRVHLGLAPSGTSSSAPGNVSVNLRDSSDSSLATKAAYYANTRATNDYDADQIHHTYVDLTADDDSVTDDTQFILQFTSNQYIRIHSIMVEELHGSVLSTDKDAVANPQHWQQLRDIHYRGVKDILEAATVLWQHNATVHLSWGNRAATPVTVNYASPGKNLFDATATAWGANNPGIYLDCTRHDTHSGDVPFELMLYANRTAGTGTLTIDILKSGGTVKSWTGIGGSDPLYTTTFTHAATDEKIDFLAYTSDGASTTFEVFALALYEYESGVVL